MAQYNTFFVSHSDDGQAQEALNSFIRAHRVIRTDRAAFPDGWAFCVEWLEGKNNAASGFAKNTGKVDYRDVLDPEAFARFVKLRERRKEIADADGVKAYVVLTDAQLAEIAKIDSPTVSDMQKIDGVGESRIKLYAERLLEARG